jgi:hypothetical protein
MGAFDDCTDASTGGGGLSEQPPKIHNMGGVDLSNCRTLWVAIKAGAERGGSRGEDGVYGERRREEIHQAKGRGQFI